MQQKERPVMGILKSITEGKLDKDPWGQMMRKNVFYYRTKKI